MANKQLFSSSLTETNGTTAQNQAGGSAYVFDDRHALAQLVVTGTLGDTYYVSAEGQLADLLSRAKKLAKTDPRFVAQAAVYARERAFMKDTPALLLAVLAAEPSDEARACLKAAFPLVIDNGKMLRNFMQMIRSGKVGRKSFGTSIKRMIQKWIENRNSTALFKDSIGNDPSLSDVIKMVHPRPTSQERASLYSYLIGNKLDGATKLGNLPTSSNDLPGLTQQFEAWKLDRSQAVPDVPFQMLTSVPLTTEQWTAIALKASWQTIRMNLNTFARHGVFGNPEVVSRLAARLADPVEVKRSKVFPYQLLMSYKAIGTDIPSEIRAALEQAMEVAIDNVPAYDGNVFVCADVSGSMSSPVTGHRAGATTNVRCIDVAALVASAIYRKNPGSQVLPFATGVEKSLHLSRTDSIMTNATKLGSIGGGGTNCAAPLELLNSNKLPVDLIIFVSDNESWVNDRGIGRQTGVMKEWNLIKQRNPNAKMICIDLQPNTTTQALNDKNVLNVGGFSDAVFDICNQFLIGKRDSNVWVSEINEIKLGI